MAELSDDVRETVRKRYADAAKAAARGPANERVGWKPKRAAAAPAP
jgi:hypothetical protein